jgi:hypothetical protein
VSRRLTAAVTDNRRITPAGEWLLDNFYLIEEQINTAKRHLPKGYSRELPRLAHGPSAGRPRVYDIALEIVAHGDGRVDADSLSRFVASYQTVTVLDLGELWAIPIMLRLALIENLRRVGVRVAAAWDERDLADTWADRMIETAEQDAKSLIVVIADMARSNPPMVSAFVAELARRLQGRGPAVALALSWIEQRLLEAGLTIAQLVQSESQQQAADQVSVSNSIGSLRALGAMDWRAFVESMSIVEQTLVEDPGGIYGRMDFATRDHYRHATERIAKKSNLSEAEVARKAVELARAAADSGAGERQAHVGFYLIDQGLPTLEQAAHVRLGSLDALRRTAGQRPLLPYLGAIALITAIMTAGLLTLGHLDRVPLWVFVPTGLLSLLAASQLAVALVNWIATLLVTPQPLPRMDFSGGIAPHSRTLVVVPTMLASASGIEDLVEALEVRFLANRDECLHFGLVTDFLDAPQASLPEDEPLVQLARERIEALNAKYAGSRGLIGNDRFFLFHRPRRWNPQERLWMGHERKRGKLEDVIALLRACALGVHEPANDAFALVVGDTAVLSGVEYVITLDTDTQLPRDAARQFVGAMAHPLNRPHYDEAKAPRHGRLRHPAAARGRQPAEHQPLPLCTTVWRGAGHRPVHARRVGRLPGRVRRRLVHRQGHLPCRYVRAGARGTPPREPDSQPRSPGGLLRARRTAQRRVPVRGLSGALQRRCQPAPPLDSRRLAARIVAVAPGAVRMCRRPNRPRHESPEESAIGAVAMEAVRQPAAQSRARSPDAAVAAGMDGLAVGVVVDPGGTRHHGWFPACASPSSTRAASPRRCRCASTWGRSRTRLHVAPCRSGSNSPVFPTRPSSASMRSCAPTGGSS